MEKSTLYNKLNEKFKFETKKYFLIKENFVYKINIENRKDSIFIKTRNYFINLTISDIDDIFKNGIIFNNINECYNFIINSFEENNAFINNFKNYEFIEIFIKIPNQKKKFIELTLLYDKLNKNNNIFDKFL